MPTRVLPRWRAALNHDLLNDRVRASMLAGILKVAPECALMSIPSIAASFAALGQRGAELDAGIVRVASLLAELKAAISARDISRTRFDGELDSLKGLVENNATSGADITGMGFVLLTIVKASQTPPDPPGALVVTIGRAHGKARVSVPGKGYQGSFVAELAENPNGPWTSLPGTRKSRKLSGYPTGTQLWVRFAAVRYGLQGPWGTAVLVTIP